MLSLHVVDGFLQLSAVSFLVLFRRASSKIPSSATSMPRFVSSTAKFLLLPSSPCVLRKKRDANRFITRTEQEALQHCDSYLKCFTSLQATLHCPDEIAFPCTSWPWRVYVDSDLPALPFLFQRRWQCGWRSWPTLSYLRRRSFLEPEAPGS